MFLDSFQQKFASQTTRPFFEPVLFASNNQNTPGFPKPSCRCKLPCPSHVLSFICGAVQCFGSSGCCLVPLWHHHVLVFESNLRVDSQNSQLHDCVVLSLMLWEWIWDWESLPAMTEPIEMLLDGLAEDCHETQNPVDKANILQCIRFMAMNPKPDDSIKNLQCDSWSILLQGSNVLSKVGSNFVSQWSQVHRNQTLWRKRGRDLAQTVPIYQILNYIFNKILLGPKTTLEICSRAPEDDCWVKVNAVAGSLSMSVTFKRLPNHKPNTTDGQGKKKSVGSPGWFRLLSVLQSIHHQPLPLFPAPLPAWGITRGFNTREDSTFDEFTLVTVDS